MAAQPRRLSARFSASQGSEVYAVRWAPDGELLAAGCSDGSVRIVSARTGEPCATLLALPAASERLPITALRWRPPAAGGAHSGVLLACGADGVARHWHAASGRLLHTLREPGNQIFAAAYRADSLAFATGGKDHVVRVYDETSRALVASLVGGTKDVTPGHSNRIFSIVFMPGDDSIVLSAGWDNTVQVYDVRAGHAVRSLYGPHVCGDALDVDGGCGAILTGSWRASEQLQLWDYATGRLTATLPWAELQQQQQQQQQQLAFGGAAPPQTLLPSQSPVAQLPAKLAGPPAGSLGSSSSSSGAPPGVSASVGAPVRPPAAAASSAPSTTLPSHTLLYAAAFSKRRGGGAGSLIAAGGSGANEVRVYDRAPLLKGGATTTLAAAEGGGAPAALDAGGCVPALVAAITGLPRGVYTLDWDGTETALVVAGGDGILHVIDVLPVGQQQPADAPGVGVAPLPSSSRLSVAAPVNKRGGADGGAVFVLDLSRAPAGGR